MLKIILSLLILLFANLIFPLSSFAQTNTTEETLTITTYYPAPYGVYNEMRAKRMAVGTDYYNGSAYPWDIGGGKVKKLRKASEIRSFPEFVARI